MSIAELIHDNPKINITLTASDLIEFSKNLAEHVGSVILNSKKENLLTRKEALEKFQISDATLWRWDRLKIIKSVKLGGRIYYTESEIERVLSLK